MRCTALSSALLLSLLAAASGKADVILSNLAGSNDLALTNLGTPGTSKALGFTMTSNMFLTSARLRLGSGNVAHSPVVTLMSNAGNNPSTVLATFQNPTLGGGLLNYLFTLQTPYELVSGSTYWISVGGNATTAALLWGGSSPSVTPIGTTATFVGARINNTLTSVVVNSFELIGNAPPATVPEPGAVITLSAAVLGLGLCTRKRRGAIHS